MNKSLAFFGREKQIDQLRSLYLLRKHVLIVGPAGIGKTALLRQVRQTCPVLLCEETSSLRRICDGLERQPGWAHRKLNVIERKNRLLAYLGRRAEPVAFADVALIRGGGSIPIVAEFRDILGAEPLLLGLGLPDCRMHSPNENFPIENLEAGIRLNQVLLRELA